MATTARLPEALKTEAQAYADRLGISLNALLAVALRDYLDGRRTTGATGPAPAALPQSPQGGAQVKPPKNPRAPCPCGSGQQYRHCHGRA